VGLCAQGRDWHASAVRAILAGRTRVELCAEEAIAALKWARSVQGWDPDALAPVWIYPAAPDEA
jgi:hypothetical protein